MRRKDLEGVVQIQQNRRDIRSYITFSVLKATGIGSKIAARVEQGVAA
jgi:hypothetical protein